MPLLGPDGNVITSSSFAKGASPVIGEAFAPRWAGDYDKYIFNMPGGGTVLFDLSKLKLSDFRTMRDHYQVNATLTVLAFMLHQMDWKIECDNPKIVTQLTENIENIWTPMIRALSQAFWAGYSPNILQFENGSKYIELTKVKDMLPEECYVNWNSVDGYAPPGSPKPKIRIFDGMKIIGQQWPVPAVNSLWYPLLMENGDYFGKKLLRPVFTSWYFSILMHLFSNRYFERFGEPVPVGRAPYDEEITIPTSGGPKKVLGADLMVQVLQNLRNRSVVVLPNDRTQIGQHGGAHSTEFDYNIEYLESQMRGADFERYLMRLDEEISLGLFTPLLILRTADVGSYNLGSTHWSMYLNMLHAISSDMKYYIDNFILSRLVDANWGVNAPRARIKFRKLADDRKDMIMQMMQGLVSSGNAMPDLNQLGEVAGISMEKIQQLAPVAPPTGPAAPKKAADTAQKTAKTGGTKPDATKSQGDKKSVSKNTAAILADIASDVLAKPDCRTNPEFGSPGALAASFGMDFDGDEQQSVDEILRLTSLWLREVPAEVDLTSDAMSKVMVSVAEGLMNAE